MIDYLERSLSQAPEDREPLPDRPSLPAALTVPPPARTEGRFLLSERTKEPSLLSEQDAPKVSAAAPTPGVLERTLARAEAALQPMEQTAPAVADGAVTFRRGRDGDLRTLQAPSVPMASSAGAEPANPAAQIPAAAPVQPLLTAVRRSDSAADFVRRQSRTFSVTLPDTPARSEPGLTAQELDRAVERDARRYDGGFSLY